MHNNLPSTLDHDAYALDPQTNTETLPVQYLPDIEGYSTVCLHVRESQLIASNQPATISCHHMQPQASGGGQYGGQYAVPGATFAAKRSGRKNLVGWVCVGQLAIIIGLVGFQNWHLDYKSSLERLQGTAITSGVALRSLFNDSIIVPMGLSSLVSSADNNHYGNQRSKSKSKSSKPASRGKSHGWNIGNNFIPPPPPGFTMPKSAMMVPPPPVAYPIATAGSGAVAASTLPTTHSSYVAQQTINPTASDSAQHASSSQATPRKEGTDSHVGTVATAPNTVEDPGPEWFAPLPKAPVESPAVSQPGAMSTPVFEYRTTTEARPSRTVLSGRRIRTITDR